MRFAGGPLFTSVHPIELIVVAHDPAMEVEFMVSCPGHHDAIDLHSDFWRVLIVLEDPEETGELEKEDSSGTKRPRTPRQGITPIRSFEKVVIWTVHGCDQVVGRFFLEIEESSLVELHIGKVSRRLLCLGATQLGEAVAIEIGVHHPVGVVYLAVSDQEGVWAAIHGPGRVELPMLVWSARSSLADDCVIAASRSEKRLLTPTMVAVRAMLV